MKKFLVLILSVLMLFALCACSASKEPQTTTTEPTTESTTQPTTSSNPLDNVTAETGADVTKPDGSVNEEIIGTTVGGAGDEIKTTQRASAVSPENNTTKSGSFETDIIPIE